MSSAATTQDHGVDTGSLSATALLASSASMAIRAAVKSPGAQIPKRHLRALRLLTQIMSSMKELDSEGNLERSVGKDLIFTEFIEPESVRSATYLASIAGQPKPDLTMFRDILALSSSVTFEKSKDEPQIANQEDSIRYADALAQLANSTTDVIRQLEAMDERSMA